MGRMRIITGKYRNKLIHMPRGIRPTQNKVRKALFDILGDVEGLSFLELFAGSGAIGFEAVSRGASRLVLVEYNYQCGLAIRKNISALAIRSCEFYPQEAEKAVEFLRRKAEKFDIIFLDPPYYEGLSKKTLQMLGACDILAPNGFVVIQHFKKDELPEAAGPLTLIKKAGYGDTLLSFYRRETNQ